MIHFYVYNQSCFEIDLKYEIKISIKIVKNIEIQLALANVIIVQSENKYDNQN